MAAGRTLALVIGVAQRPRVREFAREYMARADPPISIVALARRSGVAVNTISNWLNGKSWPQPGKLASLEKALGLPPGEFDRIAAGADPVKPQAQPGPDGDGEDARALDRMVVGFAPGVLAQLTPAQFDEAVAVAKIAAYRAIREMTGAEGDGG